MSDPHIQHYAHRMMTPKDDCLMGDDELKSLVVFAKDRTVIEIGSFRGGSAREMLPVCKHLTCIDPHDDLWWFNDKKKGEPADQNGKLIQADFLEVIAPYPQKCTYVQKYSQDCVQEMGKTDVLFVDGDHSFESCKQDLELYIPQTHPEWVICHDFCVNFCGVIAACIGYFKRNPDYLISSLAIWRIKDHAKK